MFSGFSQDIIHAIHSRIALHECPRRTALSSRFPRIKGPLIALRTLARSTQNVFNPRLARRKLDTHYPCILARHQSVLIRKLGDSDQRLQRQKVTNLRIATAALDRLVIGPGQVFSLWNTIGAPSRRKGYVEGMLLSSGRVIEGIGGGLCQLSNFLYWIFLHVDTRVVERYHHSMDVFPDSGRVLPFGSGATILYNFVDLKMKNISDQPLQLKLWLTDTHLKGQIVSSQLAQRKFHIFERNHAFVKKSDSYFRYNELWRETRVNGRCVKTERIATNFVPVLYHVTNEYIAKNQFRLVTV